MALKPLIQGEWTERRRHLFEATKANYGIVGAHYVNAVRTRLKEILPKYVPEQNGECLLEMKCSKGKALAGERTASLGVSLPTHGDCFTFIKTAK